MQHFYNNVFMKPKLLISNTGNVSAAYSPNIKMIPKKQYQKTKARQNRDKRALTFSLIPC